MTKVFTDQLAALPLSKVFINATGAGMYIAAIALEGRLLNIYEADDKPLTRSSLTAMQQCLAACGCPPQSFIIKVGAGIESLCQFAEPDMGRVVLAM